MKKQKSGLYRTHIRIGIDANGKPIEKWLSARTRTELEEKKKAVRSGYVAGYAPQSIPLFGTAVTEWYKTSKEPYISTGRKGIYRCVINNYLFPVLAERKLSSIRRTELQEILNGMTGLSASLPVTALTVLRDVFRQAVADGYIQRDITIGLAMPKCSPTKEKRALTSEERQKVEQLSTDRPWLAILYYTGCRGGEMRALRWSDIDLKSRIIHIRRSLDTAGKTYTEGKTKSAKRDVPIPDQLADILRHTVGIPTMPITGEVWSAYRLEHYFNSLQIADDLTVHYLRHNFITMCWESGLDAVITSKIVGHSNPQITLNIYTHLETSNYSDKVTDIFTALQKRCTSENANIK